MDPIIKELRLPLNFKDSPNLYKFYNYKSTQLGHMHRMRIYLFMELMDELIANKTITNFDSAIDVGCNTGLYSKILSEYGFRKVVGIDIESEYVEIAKKHFSAEGNDRTLTYKVLNAEEIDTSEQFDFILCTEVIEHTGNQAKTIENLNKILKKGGVAVITLPNVVSYPYLLTWLSYKLHGRKFNKEMQDHLSYPFYKSINLFKNKPYKVIKTTGTNLFYWHFLHKIPGFNRLNILNYKLGRLWPFKFFTQYFYVVLKNES